MPVLRRIAPLIVALCAAVPSVTAAPALAAPARVRIGTAPQLPAGATPLAAVASAQKLHVTVALAPRNAAALNRYASAVANPNSPDYRHYLSTARFAARFGPTAKTVNSVRQALRKAGLKPGALAANHLSLGISANAAGFEKAFDVTLARVLLPSKRAALVNIEAPSLPAPAAKHVQAIVGLDGLQSWRSSLERQARKGRLPSRQPAAATSNATTSVKATSDAKKRQPAACAAATSAAANQSAYTANQIAGAYRFSGLYAAGDEGAGVTVGVYELEPDLPADIAAYQNCYGTSAQVSYQSVDGGAGSGAGSGEAAFDIEQLIGLAPKAKLIVYQAPNSNADSPGTGPFDDFAQMISQDKVSVISNSWGECESVEGATDAHAENTLFEEAAIQGQTIVSAAGDDGSEDCVGPTGAPEGQLAVDDPGSQPFVTDVGGTSLTALGPPPTETAWNSGGGGLATLGLASGYGAGGGGISKLWTMPSYQSGAAAGLGVVGAHSSGAPCGNTSGDCREVPDVSADADPAHGYLIYYNSNRSEDAPVGWQGTGGTSGAAPLWAALFALADASKGCAVGPLGFANPALYRAASAAQTSYFNDVSAGNNDFTGTNKGLYPAGAGYDMATGLGTPNADALANELCAESLRLTAPASRQTFVGRAQKLSVHTADGTGVPVTVTVSGLPAGVSFDATTGVISGTPKSPGIHTVTVKATDANGASRNASFSWRIAARPTVSRLHLRGVRAAKPVLSLRVSAGKDEFPLSRVTLTLPAGLSLAKAGAAKVAVKLPSGAMLKRTVSNHGRTVIIGLKKTTPAVVISFAKGALRGSVGLSRAARRRPVVALSVGVSARDTDGGVTALRGSVRPAS